MSRMAEPTADAYEAIFTALAHPARRRILISLNFAGGSMSAGEIAGLFAHAWPTTTRHLQQLEAAGIIAHERRGRTRLYRLDNRRLKLARDWLDWFERDPVTAEEKEDGRGTEAVQDQHRGRRHRTRG
jgi:DNA-binding transcriptional ArsR family regulator